MSRSGVQRELTKAKKLDAAINNEHLTRQRVDKLENSLIVIGKGVVSLEAILIRRGFWGRLRWLIRGR